MGCEEISARMFSLKISSRASTHFTLTFSNGRNSFLSQWVIQANTLGRGSRMDIIPPEAKMMSLSVGLAGLVGEGRPRKGTTGLEQGPGEVPGLS